MSFRRVMLAGALALGTFGALKTQADEPGIYIVRTDGSEVRKITAVDGYDYHASPSWSHDGSRLAFDVADSDRVERKLYVVKLDGSDLTEMGSFGMAAWSPDDKQLACYSYGNDVEEGIWVIGVDGKGADRVCDGAWPRWSPDGSSIAHTLGNAIYVLDLETDEDRPAVDYALPERPGSYDWSRDGKRLAFFVRTQMGGNRELYIVDAAGPMAELKARYARAGMVGGHVGWSPDSKKLVFTVDSFLHILEIDGDSEPVLIPGQQERSRDPAWSPDGKWIAFARRN